MLWIFTIFFLYGASLQFPKWSDFLPTFIADIDHSTWVLNFCGFFCCFKPLTSVLLLGNQMDSHFPTILLQEPFYGKCLHYSITVHCPPCVSPGSFLLCAEHIRLKEGNESAFRCFSFIFVTISWFCFSFLKSPTSLYVWTKLKVIYCWIECLQYIDICCMVFIFW